MKRNISEIKGYTIQKATEPINIEKVTCDYLVYDERGAGLIFSQGFLQVYCKNEETNQIAICKNMQDVEQFYKHGVGGNVL